MSDASEAKCPVLQSPHTATGSSANQHWWPNQLNLNILHQGSAASNPMDDDFDYAAEFNTLDLAALKADLTALMTDSKEWWPADYGHYGPFFVRMAWHSAGTYRTHDGRGGGASGSSVSRRSTAGPTTATSTRLAPCSEPIKKKYGRKLSWADLMLLDRQRRHGVDGLHNLRFRRRPRRRLGSRRRRLLGPREPSGSTTSATPATASWRRRSAPCRWASSTSTPKARTAIPTPWRLGRDIRETFGRMAMNDEETVALVVGGHAFGKMHGAGPEDLMGAEPEGAPMEQQLLRLEERLRQRQGCPHHHSPASKARGTPPRRSGTTTTSRR